MIRIAGPRIFILIRLRYVCERVVPLMMSLVGGLRMCVAVAEDHYFVNAEDGEGARYVSCHCGAKFVGLCTVKRN